MRNYQEDIPPWKKEVLMRGDGLSKAVENDTPTFDLEDRNKNQAHRIQSKNQYRYKIGSRSSFLSKVKSVLMDKGQGDIQSATQIPTGSQDTGILRIFVDDYVSSFSILFREIQNNEKYKYRYRKYIVIKNDLIQFTFIKHKDLQSKLFYPYYLSLFC